MKASSFFRLIRALRFVVALILLQTLFFKFTGAEESVLLFSRLSEAISGGVELEALLRMGTGLVELVIVILLMLPPTSFLGACLSAGTMGGAILSHFTILGIDVGDGGLLFFLATTTLSASLLVVILSWKTQREKCWPLSYFLSELS